MRWGTLLRVIIAQQVLLTFCCVPRYVAWFLAGANPLDPYPNPKGPKDLIIIMYLGYG